MQPSHRHEGSVTLRGRTFSAEELQEIRAIVESSQTDSRSKLSLRICERLNWRQNNGQLKDRSCREALNKLHEQGFLRLPPAHPRPPKRSPICLSERTAPKPVFTPRPREIDIESFSVLSKRCDIQLWNEFVERYHYLGYGVPVGPNIKYFVRGGDEIVACMTFSGAAWKVAVRDRWIGWSHGQRHNRLHLVLNNTRFLILPWIQVKNLASRLLGLAARRVTEDWLRIYGYSPLLLETFVHVERHAGTCYRAANWICLGETKGRGKMDRHKRCALPRKSVFVYPLTPDAGDRLRNG